MGGGAKQRVRRGKEERAGGVDCEVVKVHRGDVEVPHSGPCVDCFGVRTLGEVERQMGWAHVQQVVPVPTELVRPAGAEVRHGHTVHCGCWACGCAPFPAEVMIGKP